MAYGLKYSMTWQSVNRQGIVSIWEKDYSGSSDNSLKISRGSLKITRDFSDWSQHILGATCEFDIINDKDDFFELLDLLYATEKKYLIKVSDIDGLSNVVSLFEGYINTDVVQHKYLKYQSIRIVASSYLAKMEYVESSILENISSYTFIDIIDSCLTGIGGDYNIRVNMKGYPYQVTLLSTQTALNKTGIFTERYWENNEQRKTSLDVIKDILKTFNLYLYWWDGYWYIEDYASIWETSKTYVEYTTGTSYGVDDEGVAVTATKVVNDVHTYAGLKFTELTQTLSFIPGNKINEVQTKETLWESGVSPDFRGTAIDHVTLLTNPAAEHRNWLHYWHSGEFTWDDINIPYLSIERSKKRMIDVSVDLSDVSKFDRGTYLGMCLEIKEGRQVDLSWKWHDLDYLKDNQSTITGAGADVIRFRYYLRVYIPSGTTAGTGTTTTIPAGWYYIIFRDDKLATMPTAENWWHLVADAGTVRSNDIDYDINENSDDWKNGNHVWEVSHSVNTNALYYVDTSGVRYKVLEDVFKAVFGVLTTSFVNVSHWDKTCPNAILGDIKISTVDAKIDNLFTGKVNTDFLNKTSLELDTFDLSNCNYKNGILTEGDTDPDVKLNTYTTEWHHPNLPYNPNTGTHPTAPLSDIRLAELIREKRKTRQKLTADVVENPNDILHPLALFTDSKQSDMKFVLMGIVYLLDLGKYQVDLREYDNETTVIFDE